MENTMALGKQPSQQPNIVRSIQAVLERPGAYFRYQPHVLRSFYHTAARILHPRTWVSRCLPLAFDNSPTPFAIDDDKGYAIITGIDTSGAVAEVRKIVADTDINDVRAKSVKPYLLTLLKDEQIAKDSEIYKLVTNKDLVKGVARYLKCMPILSYIAVWYSPNEAAQNFHMDHEDYRQIKAFLFIEDVDANTGPFTTLDAASSDTVQKTIGYRMTPDEKRVDDDVVYKIVSADNTQPLVGKSGDMALVDTSRCFHYGSREGNRPRILLTFQYMTPFAFVMPWNWRKKVFLGNLRQGRALTPHEEKLLGVKI
jgi:hypothetical protein